MKSKLITIVLFVIYTNSAIAQIIHQTAYPLGFESTDKQIEWFDLGVSKSDIDRIRYESKINKGRLQFAQPVEVELSPENSGFISVQKGKLNTWHLLVSSEDAASIGVIFSKYNLKEGEKIFIYDPGMLSVMGPFTSENNKESGILPIVPLKGSQLIIEYQFLKDGSGDLVVGQLSHDVLGIFGPLDNKDVDFGTSGPCNNDINCAIGADWFDEKRAVVKLIIDNSYLGSGSLVNNTGLDNIPYILTAEHVIGNATEAINTIAIFNYESPWCAGPDGSVSKSISGATLVASGLEVDFSLIELSEFPPILYKPYMAGWDVTGTTPSRTTGIHHPSGDVKKISFDLDEPMIGTFENLRENGFWWILRWDSGTTEGGSSGSPLFDSNHKIIGTLTGGQALCGNSVNDYYARLDISYDISTNHLHSLKPWLDNNNIGTSILSGRDPYEQNFLSSDTLFNGVESEYSITLYDGGENGFTTGINSDSIVSYAEKFHVNSPKELTDVFLFLGSSNYVSTEDSVNILILGDNNGPGSLIASEKVLIDKTRNNFMLRVDFSDPVPVYGTFYVAYRNWYRETADSDLRQFAVFHGYGAAPGSDFAWFKDIDGWHTFSQHPFDPGDNTLYIKAVVVDSSTVVSITEEKFVPFEILLYPNPVYNNLSIESLNSENIIQSARVMDISGMSLRRYQNINNYQFKIDDIQDLKPGLYFIELLVSGQHQVYKIIKEN